MSLGNSLLDMCLVKPFLCSRGYGQTAPLYSLRLEIGLEFDSSKTKKDLTALAKPLNLLGGSDEARTRDLRRDRRT
jgi:hypothetical protein